MTMVLMVAMVVVAAVKGTKARAVLLVLRRPLEPEEAGSAEAEGQVAEMTLQPDPSALETSGMCSRKENQA